MQKSIPHFIVSKLLLLVFCALALSACRNSKSHRPEQKYDIYEVRVSSSLAVREGPSRNARKICDIYNGTTVKVNAIENGWAKVYYNNYDTTTVYVSADYILFKEYGPHSPLKWAEEIALHPELAIPKFNEHTTVADSAGIFGAEDYAALLEVEVPEPWKYVIVTADTVAPLEIYGYADRLYKVISDTVPDEDHTIVVSYVADIRLADARMPDRLTNYLANKHSREMFDAQYDASLASTTPVEAIIGLMRAVNAGIEGSEETPWYKRWFYSGSDFVDSFFELVVIDNIVPNDGFGYRWLSWLYKYPFKFMLWLTSLLGSPVLAFAFLALIIVAACFFLRLYGFRQTAKPIKSINVGTLYLFIFFRGLLSVIAIITLATGITLLIPSMDSFFAVQQSGQLSAENLQCIADCFQMPAPGASWWLKLLIFVFFFISLYDPEIYPCTFLRRDIQIKIIEEKMALNPEDSGINLFSKSNERMNFTSLSEEKLLQSDNPMSEILQEKAGDRGRSSFFLISLMFILSTPLAWFALFTIGSAAINNIITMVFAYKTYDRQGLLQESADNPYIAGKIAARRNNKIRY